MTTDQEKQWAGGFGKAYTDRNPRTPETMDALHIEQFGISRSELNREFLGSLDRSIRVLEVGANVGMQLELLRRLGFTQLYGVELQFYAIQQSRSATTGLRLVQGSGFALPFPDAAFDLVFTSGVLIHISPDDIGRMLDEIHRCARMFIWGWEYFAEHYTQVNYRGETDLLWKTDFAKLYRDRFPNLDLLKERRVKYLKNDNVDSMFLLKKR